MCDNLPEVKCSRAMMDFMQMYLDLTGLGSEGGFKMMCEFKQLSTPDADNRLPLDREFIVYGRNEFFPMEIYGKCVDDDICRYYFVYNGDRYFMTKGTTISPTDIANALDFAQVPAPKQL